MNVLLLVGLLVDGNGLYALDCGVLRGRDEHLGLSVVKDDLVFFVGRSAEGTGGDKDHDPEHAQQDADTATFEMGESKRADSMRWDEQWKVWRQ